MKTKYTQGEWVVSNQDENGIFIATEERSGAIARVYSNNALVMDNAIALANANLITAAPDLLEALEEMQIMFRQWIEQDKETQGYKWALKAQEAMKKAKGE
jgi:hypothetical protein